VHVSELEDINNEIDGELALLSLKENYEEDHEQNKDDMRLVLDKMENDSY